MYMYMYNMHVIAMESYLHTCMYMWTYMYVMEWRFEGEYKWW